ncbi:sulfite exporter TauE/SafE family protein [Candidatus Nitrotoga sp. 1052]|uniref:sulfite exporter TauE/SafE family protein n=1 Tax=Candidatus Nitrotoga sp. 1052 TaxID=2886964 RepID=UPI001EF70F1A|nr:sulfite exporter TauE/SafE family protein [Candidatus Nitrotoga sp. 1052]CAH1076361.1 putative membrane transporter protein [Candidatus Nitrotoga sp. 1052]
MEWAFAYVALGALVGLFSGMFGIGGGTILVPVLLILFKMQHFPAPYIMHLVLGTSMATIVFTSLASMRKHHQHGAVNWVVVRTMTPGILFGTALGALCAASVSPRGLGIFFALFVYCAAIQILFELRPQASRQLPGMTGMTLTGMFTGWISSLVSIGGGTVVVPFLIWCNVPIRNAIGTSAAIGFPVAIGGTTGYIITGLSSPLPSPNLGFVYLPSVLWIAFASVITAPLGAKAVHRMKIGLLRKLFAILMLVLGTHLLIKFI